MTSGVQQDSESEGDTGYEVFARSRWAALPRRSGSTTSDVELRQLIARTGEPISIKDVVDIYLPLTEFLTVLAEIRNTAQQKVGAFLGEHLSPRPFIVGIAGGIAVGKSTTARILQELLRCGNERFSVELVTTDSFLFPNAVLEERGLLGRKGFPESYDQRRLTDTLTAIRAGDPQVAIPLYSHLSYDIVPESLSFVRQPDILIVEGLNVLQLAADPPPALPGDFFDISIYIDAAETDVAEWFQRRLFALRSTQHDSASFFHRLESLSDEEFVLLADQVWSQVNVVNLRENIAPTRARADLILEKGSEHLVERVLLRRP
jgi:type I pantothenate kinase